MLNSLFSWFLGLLKGVAAHATSFLAGGLWEKEKNKRKDVEEKLKDIKDAKDIHKRLASDDSFAKRVRDRFTR